MKRSALAVALLSMFVVFNAASANEFSSANICQPNSGTVSYHWEALYADAAAYVICPVTRTYSNIQTGRIYVSSNPSGGYVCGWVNFISYDGSYQKCSAQKCTTATGRSVIDFGNNPVDTKGMDGYYTFDVDMPAGTHLAGFYSN